MIDLEVRPVTLLASRPSARRNRYVENLFGEATRPEESKVRWARAL